MVQHSYKRRKINHESDNSQHSDVESKSSEIEGQTIPQELGVSMGKNSASSETVTDVRAASYSLSGSAMHANDNYKSTMFKLQVDEMLAEVRPNLSKRLDTMNGFLHRLKTAIENISDREPLSVSNSIKALQKLKVKIPFSDPKPDSEVAYKFSYARPSNVNIVGSYALQTMVKSQKMLIDMVVTMPSNILQEKDYLNYRYFYKRAYYLACIASGLDKSLWHLEYDLLNGNDLQPILLVRTTEDAVNIVSATSYTIRVIPAAPEDYFSTVKLQPCKNAIRPIAKPDGEAVQTTPTPFYNASLMSDGSYGQYLKLLHHSSKKAEGFRDGCILGRIWLQQRGFGSSLVQGGFGSFEWSALMACLLQGGGPKGHSVLSLGYSSFQLFKATIQYIASIDLAARPVSFQAGDVELPKTNRPVFYDGPRGLNLLFKMTASGYASLREEAKSSLAMLNETAFDQFESTFIIKKDNPYYAFDSLFSFRPVHNLVKLSQDHLDDQQNIGIKIYDVLKEGLGNRVQEIQIRGDEPTTWSVTSARPERSYTLTIGVVFDSANIGRLVDHGPTAEDKKAATRFQKFWGEKAELRRFKDGSILESLVWTGTDNESIFQEIVSYLFPRHFDGKVEFHEDKISTFITASASTKTFDALKESYRIFQNDIKALEELPLQLRSLSAAGSHLRLSSIQPPIFSPRHHLQEPAEVIIQFEGSGRWPDDIVAIQRTKIAFLLKIGKLLEDSVDGLVARVGLENSGEGLANCGFLDAVYPSGAVFRLRMQNDREQTLLERIVKGKSIEPYVRDSALAALLKYKQIYLQLPIVSESIATHCTRFPILSPTMRLVKRWFGSHKLVGHIPEEVIEILTMRTFLQPYPWKAPTSATTGLLRTLQFISRWDWRTTPVVVDFGGTMTAKEIAAANTRLEAWRKIDPSMNRVALVIVTSHDPTGTIFTDGRPTKVIAARMTALARSACVLVKDFSETLLPESLFKTSNQDFDFIVHFTSKFSGTNRGNKSKEIQFKNLEIQQQGPTQLIGYKPSELFVSELRALYGSSVIFFHDSITNNVIGGLWNPQTRERPFRVNLPYASKPVKDIGQVGVDKAAILSEIAQLGGDLISRIEVNRE